MSYHVLIVEDDSALRQLYCLYLERGQYKYTAVASTQEVLDALSILARLGFVGVFRLPPHLSL